ncbi:hypothetical protein ABGB14_48160 [Nonomuraea sp. B10E15]|uniref:hypothetical protein n=1 Tax=Nonomuraea sp. B10E15 TaxID=3153560 RepID=UPI00325EABD6
MSGQVLVQGAQCFAPVSADLCQYLLKRGMVELGQVGSQRGGDALVAFLGPQLVA